MGRLGSVGMPKVKVETDIQSHEFEVNAGDNLRKALLQQGISPYGSVSKTLNCGGRGLCATCGVIPINGVPSPKHWHDVLASNYRYPRLSCQIRVHKDMHIKLVSDKVMWGKRIKKAHR